MTDTWTKRWNDRFRQKEFAYGTEPNEFLKEQIQKLKAGPGKGFKKKTEKLDPGSP